MPILSHRNSPGRPSLRLSRAISEDRVIQGSPADRLQHAEALLAARNENSLAAFYSAEVAGADPDRCAAGRWTAQMLKGDFGSAWIECDTIRYRAAPDPHRFWDGQPIDGRKVIVRCLHGLGDAIQFLRYMPRLRARASSVVVEVPPGLYQLASCIEDIGEAITWGKLAPSVPVHWDVQMEVMELPYIFRTSLYELPIASNYLRIPESLRSPIASIPSLYPRVGIVWAAGGWNPARSLPFSHVRRLLAKSDCEFWSLQGGSPNAEWLSLPPSDKFRDGAEFGRGLLRLATLVYKLDLVITVDTLAAHLAGAMGKPTWVLLNHAADWRWLTNRNDSPWYPSARLFRQPTPGNWETLIDVVEEELQLWTAKHNRQILIA